MIAYGLLEIIIENYFSNLNLVQDTSSGNTLRIAFQQGLQPYTIGVNIGTADKDGFYSGRDNGLIISYYWY